MLLKLQKYWGVGGNELGLARVALVSLVSLCRVVCDEIGKRLTSPLGTDQGLVGVEVGPGADS